jgi:hypothetical protein
MPEGSEENYEKPVTIADLWAEILIRDFPNTKQECGPLDREIG